MKKIPVDELAELNLGKNKTWTINSRAASNYVSSALKDMGPCCISSVLPLAFAIPKAAQRMFSLLISEQDLKLAKVVLESAFSQLPYSIKKIHETGSDLITVAKITGTELQEFFLCRGNPKSLICYRDEDGRKIFKEYCSIGFASSGSHSDQTFLDHNERFVVMFIEEKNTSNSPFEQFGQEASEGSNGILSQLKMGTPWDDCIVLLIATNGHLYQFGCATFLEPRFLNVCVLSNVLDALSPQGCNDIAKFLVMFKDQCYFQQTIISSKSPHAALPSPTTWSLSDHLYHTKNADQVVLHYKNRNSAAGWIRYMHTFNIIWSCQDLRQHVVFPLGFQMNESEKLEGVIFNRLDSTWLLGIPTESSKRDAYCMELKRILKLIHAIGLVHMDCMPCNIAYYFIGDTIHMKLLDFDTACDINCDLPKAIIDSSRSTNKSYVWSDSLVASPMVDAWLCYLYQNVDIMHCANVDINAINASSIVLEPFFNWILEAKKAGLVSGVHFIEWYKQNWLNVV